MGIQLFFKSGVICCMNIQIREATIEDAVLVADLSQRTFFETFAKSNTEEDMQKFLKEQFTRGKLILEVGQPGLQFFLAYLDKQVAGYVKLRTGKNPPPLHGTKALEIARLYAAEAFIGKGVGKALMQKSIAVAQAAGKNVVWLGVWEKNTRAIAFYHKWGFTQFGETDFLLGNDLQRDWLMKKDVKKG